MVTGGCHPILTPATQLGYFTKDGGGLPIGFSLASSLFAAGSRTPGVVKEGPGGEGDDDDDEDMEGEEGDEEGSAAEEADPMVETAEGGPAPWAPLECRSGSATTCKRGGGLGSNHG